MDYLSMFTVYIHTYITLHYINTYIHYIHTYITYIHTYVRTYIHTYIHAHIHTHTYTCIYTYVYTWYYVIICVWVCISILYIWVLVKIKVSRAATTAHQPRSQRCQSREGSVVCDAILRRESSKHCCISQYLETWREPGTTQAGLTIAEQSRINREPIADFIDIVCKLNWSGLLDFELVVLILLCYWLSLLNTVSRQTRIQYKSV